MSSVYRKYHGLEKIQIRIRESRGGLVVYGKKVKSLGIQAVGRNQVAWEEARRPSRSSTGRGAMVIGNGT